ncbi:MAG: CoA pyrophosphatase [Bacteroidia bacterium]|nr:CoA pyrophosphatase [Bacteroidia bacterium]
MTAVLLNNLKNTLVGPLPGAEAQSRLAPVNRTLIDPAQLKPGEYKPSAVMVLLYKNAMDELFFPLIQRVEYEGVHSGQISLPGGKQEESDRDLEQTAIRECYEEIGVEGEIQLLGKLSPLYIPVSGYLVQPYVSFLNTPSPWFRPQVREVSAVYSIKLRDLLDDTKLNKGSVKVKDYSVITPYFLLEDKQVWGATAMILSEMKALLKPIF